MSLDIQPNHLQMVKDVLHTQLPAGAHVWVFGSRAKHTARRGSDLDLAIDAGRSLTSDETRHLTSAFEDSDLPYTVDVVDLHSVSDSFRDIIQKTAKPL